jgi:hypothetical protein
MYSYILSILQRRYNNLQIVKFSVREFLENMVHHVFVRYLVRIPARGEVYFLFVEF